MLRLSQKLAWGEPTSFKKSWKDLCGREWAYLVPPALFVIYIGLAPGVFFKTMDASVQNLVSSFKAKTAMTISPAPRDQKPAAIVEAKASLSELKD
jgi:NADH-quinone oxidoreductase subunit M